MSARAEAERALQARLLGLPAVKKAKTVGVYEALGSEISISGVINALRDQGIVTAFPLVVSKEAMVFVKFDRDDNNEVLKNPKTLVTNISRERNVRADELDVILIPGIAFDAHGRRLGQAGGYYDRFLPHISPGCVTIGIAFDEQIVDEVPTSSHDRSVKYVVTPTRLITAER